VLFVLQKEAQRQNKKATPIPGRPFPVSKQRSLLNRSFKLPGIHRQLIFQFIVKKNGCAVSGATASLNVF